MLVRMIYISKAQKLRFKIVKLNDLSDLNEIRMRFVEHTGVCV
jgi:hypothetical protein